MEKVWFETHFYASICIIIRQLVLGIFQANKQ